MENRRRNDRESAVSLGTCHVEGDSSDLWRDCGVFDFSTHGVGMDLRHPGGASDLVGRRISLRLRLGASIDVTLTGEVRNAKPGPDGVVRAGVEFVGLSDTERTVFDLLELGAGARRFEEGE